jgi:hypothetical protein
MAPSSDNVIVLSSDDDNEMVRCRTRSKRARKPSPFPLDDVLARADNLVRLTRTQLVKDNVRLQNANDRMKAVRWYSLVIRLSLTKVSIGSCCASGRFGGGQDQRSHKGEHTSG